MNSEHFCFCRKIACLLQACKIFIGLEGDDAVQTGSRVASKFPAPEVESVTTSQSNSLFSECMVLLKYFTSRSFTSCAIDLCLFCTHVGPPMMVFSLSLSLSLSHLTHSLISLNLSLTLSHLTHTLSLTHSLSFTHLLTLTHSLTLTLVGFRVHRIYH